MRFTDSNGGTFNVHAKADRARGVGSFGYGGANLYVVALVDCFSPPHYFVRADSLEDAYYIAQEMLCSSFDDWATGEEKLELGAILASLHAQTPGADDALNAFTERHTLTTTESGRWVSSDDDLRIALVLASDVRDPDTGLMRYRRTDRYRPPTPAA